VLGRIAGLPDRGDPALLVAGSTWPEDEAVLLPALAQVRMKRPDVRLLLVPHRPSDSGFERIQRLASDHGLTAQLVTDQRGGSSEPGRGSVAVLNAVGPLASLYRVGALAYVGGGFGGRGLHSVLEPAAWSRPVIVGPHWRESGDAQALMEAGGLLPLDRPAVPALVSRWLALLDDAAMRKESGKKARAVVERGAGAAERIAGVLATSVPPPPRP
jgi:3-deoxy-D-manno-octulosonic-acid transferase